MENEKQGYSLKDCIGWLNLGVILARGGDGLVKLPVEAAVSINGFLKELLDKEEES